jgi:hypothetical protein
LKQPNLTCKVCGRPEKFDFYVLDEIWHAIVPPKYRGKVVCLSCFDDFAKEKDINYSSALQDLCFAGEKATFRFKIAWAGDD